MRQVLVVFAHNYVLIETFRSIYHATGGRGSTIFLKIELDDATYYFRKARDYDDVRNIVGGRWDEVYILSPEQTEPIIFREIRASMKPDAKAYIWRLPFNE